MPKALKYAGLFLAVLTAVFLLACNQALAGLAAPLAPGAHFWVFLALLLVEAAGFVWLWRGIFGRRRHLAFDAADAEGRGRMARELANRLRENTHLKAAGLTMDPADPLSTAACLALLREKADEETRRTAERIFLATTLSQNGRIDAIIVFVSLCRLVWRISAIYNQRPHPAEVVSLYWAVATSTFLAFSFEELDIATEVSVGFSEAFHAMAPATVTGGLPFVGAALQKFTASAIDGAANCFLALRAGIITRNAYAYALSAAERPGRGAVFKEAGAALLAMSHKLIEQFSKNLGDALWGLTRAAGNKTALATVQAGQAVVDGAVKAGAGLSSGMGKLAANTGGIIRQAGQSVASGVAGAAAATGRTMAAPFRKKGKDREQS